MLYEDLIENFNAVCEKNSTLKAERDLAIEKTNDEIARRGCLEIELAGLREELKKIYQELSKCKMK